MARLSATVTVAAVFFLLILEVAIARSLYQNNVAVRDTLPLPESAAEPLRLPSDGVHSFPDPDAKPTDVPESNPTDVTESKPISVAVKADEQARDIPDSSPITVRSVPLTSISLHDLRPINRHFPLRMGFRRFPCGHSHHLHSHPFLQPMKRTARMSFGDDMMISKADEEGGRDSDSENWARSFRLPYHHFHHSHHHHDGDDDDDGEEGIPGFVLKHHRFGKEKLSKHWHKKVDDDDDQEDDDEKEKGEKRKKKEENEKGEKRKKKKEKEQKGGFVKRILKFLDHLF